MTAYSHVRQEQIVSEQSSEKRQLAEGEYKHDPSAPVGLMQKVSQMIAYLQNVLNNFGDSCVYVRPGGVSWGAVALNRESEDRKLGVPGSDLDRVTRDYSDLAKRHRCQSEAIVERFNRICELQAELLALRTAAEGMEKAARKANSSFQHVTPIWNKDTQRAIDELESALAAYRKAVGK